MEEWAYLLTKDIRERMLETFKGRFTVWYYSDSDLLHVSLACDEFTFEKTVERWSEKVVTRKFTTETFVKEFESDYRKYVTRLTLNRVLKIRA